MFSILIAYSEACRRAMHLFYTRHVRTIPHRATAILFPGFHHTSCFFYALFSICSIVCLLYCRSNLQECLIGCSCFFLRLLFVFVPLFHSHDRSLFSNLLTQDLLLYLKGNFTF